MPRYIEKISQTTLPLIPMRGLVAYPSIPINFELQRDLSVSACDYACKNGMHILLLTQRDISVENPTAKDLYNVGTIAKIKQTLKTPEGFTRVIAEGVCRAEVLSITDNGSFLSADVMSKVLAPVAGYYDIKMEALRDAAFSTFDELLDFLPSVSDEMVLTIQSIENPGMFADCIASNALIKFKDKQAVLEKFDPAKRLETLVSLLAAQLKMLRLEDKINRKVKENIDDGQREYYLREQLKVIQGELGLDTGDDPENYAERIDAAKLPAEVNEKLKKEVARLARTPVGSPDATVIRNYLDVCLEIPWNKRTEDRLDVVSAKKILDADHNGLDKVKARILEYLAVKQLNPDLKNQIICLVGPPGVGKTSLAASIAKAMKRKYVRVSLGGVRDEADIRGHRKTYVGAMPGRIIDGLTHAGSLNPVMLLDEIDKMCSDLHGDPASALLEVLDPEQNKYFRDHFIELPVDLSECLFITTANTLDTVPRPLIDRMEVIRLNTYTPSEKLRIAKNHLLPKQLKRHGLTKKNVKIPDAVLAEMIKGYTRESGVRNLEREIASLCRKAARELIETGSSKVSVTLKNLETYLGPVKFIDDDPSLFDECGIVNGLAYTEVGGDVLKIETAVMNGTGKIELTGSLGDVMKESARIAVSYIRVHCAELGIESDFYKTKDIHIHVPEGAVPKDGPSAGATMLTSIASALSGKLVRHDIAMTGELTLTGKVLPIGGLREKASAAFAAGIRHILIPSENVRDLAEIPSEITDAIEFTPCKKAKDVLSVALIPSPVKMNANLRKSDAKREITQPVAPPDTNRPRSGSILKNKNGLNNEDKSEQC